MSPWLKNFIFLFVVILLFAVMTEERQEHDCRVPTISEFQEWMNSTKKDRWFCGVPDGIVGRRTITAWENYSIDMSHEDDMEWFCKDVRIEWEKHQRKIIAELREENERLRKELKNGRR